MRPTNQRRTFKIGNSSSGGVKTSVKDEIQKPSLKKLDGWIQLYNQKAAISALSFFSILHTYSFAFFAFHVSSSFVHEQVYVIPYSYCRQISELLEI
jgi:hypothetical protein